MLQSIFGAKLKSIRNVLPALRHRMAHTGRLLPWCICVPHSWRQMQSSGGSSRWQACPCLFPSPCQLCDGTEVVITVGSMAVRCLFCHFMNTVAPCHQGALLCHHCDFSCQLILIFFNAEHSRKRHPWECKESLAVIWGMPLVILPSQFASKKQCTLQIDLSKAN